MCARARLDGDGCNATCSVTCGNDTLEAGEEVDPPVSPFTTISIDPATCRWDFSSINQLYCNGTWSWAGPNGCDQAAADIFCKLLTDNPSSTATSWTDVTALDEPGFNGNQEVTGVTINTDRGVSEIVRYKDDSLLTDGFHGAGSVIANPVCTDP